MFKLKEKNNLEYLWVCLKLGIGVLAYRLSMELIALVLSIPTSLIMGLYPDNQELTVILNYGMQILYSIGSFAFAAILTLVLLNVGKRRNFQGMYMRFRAPLLAPLFIISTVAINFAAAELNAMLINFMSSNAMNSMTYQYASMSTLEIVLLFVSTAIIPAIVEELMFRGIILTNLTPYGRGMAIVTSALLFGLMHMNPQQFFYATILGVILGYVYVKTRSIWICMLIHFANNGIAVVQEVLFGKFEYDVALKYSSILSASVITLGLISILVLLAVRAVKRKKAPEEIGSFGRICEPSLSYEERPVSRGGKILLFFNPTVSLFTIIVFGSMFVTAGSLMLIGIIYGFFPSVPL